MFLRNYENPGTLSGPGTIENEWYGRFDMGMENEWEDWTVSRPDCGAAE